MDSFYVLLIACALGAVLLMLFIFKRDLALKYWGYIAGGIAAVGAVLWAIAQRKQPDPVVNQETEKKTEELHTEISTVEQQHTVKVEEAKAEEDKTKQELAAVESIDDKQKRLEELSRLFNNTMKSDGSN